VKITETRTQPPTGGLAALDQVELSKSSRKMLADAMASCGGDVSWRTNKKNNARDLLAMAEISGRTVVRELDLDEMLRALIFIEAPVPCRPDSEGRLQKAPGMLLGLTYRQEALILPQPGYSMVQILLPRDIWHANVGDIEHGQPLCLGVQLPTAIPLSEIVLMTYGAMTMQAISIDERDYAGVLNVEAARWWQQNRHLIPLTSEPFIRPTGVNS